MSKDKTKDNSTKIDGQKIGKYIADKIAKNTMDLLSYE